MTIKLRNALFFYALFATLVAFASAQGGSFRGTRSRASRLDEDDEAVGIPFLGGVLKNFFNIDVDEGTRAIKNFFNKDVAEEHDEDVGGVLSGLGRLGNFGNKYSTPIENGWKLFNQGRSGSELNKVVNHGAKKQWSWAPSSRPNPKTDWGARSSRAIKNYFKKK